ncbi:MAG: AMP-binding protein [Candidatus Aenigmatarchaeota archaeon]
MNLNDIEKIQNKKIRKFVKLVYNFSPYYRRVFKEIKVRPEDIKSKDDLSIIPFTKKSDWVGNEENFLLKPNKNIIKFLSLKQKLLYFIDRDKFIDQLKYEFYPATFFATSGRTGNSHPCFYTRYDFDLIGKETIKFLEPFLKKLDYKIRLQVTFPYAPHLAFWHTVFGWLKQNSTFSIMLGAGRTNTQLELMEKFRTNVLIGMPSYIYYLSEMAVENKINSYLKYIITAGEYLPQEMKKRIKENFSKIGSEPIILQGYASTESKAAIFELEENGGYTINPNLHAWEIVDPKTGEPVNNGSGILVFSHLDFRGTVFLRYWTDDIISKGIVYENGSLKLIGEIKRRTDITSVHTKVKGTLIDFMAIENVLCSIREIKDYQVLIKKKNNNRFSIDEILIKIALKNKYENMRKKIVEKIREIIRDKFEITPSIRVVPFENLIKDIFEKLKGCRVKDLRTFE